MKSPFRPAIVADAAILDDHQPLIRSLERRGLIRGGLSLGALVMLTGCDVKRPKSVKSALLAISRLNDEVQALLFDPNKLAPTYPASMILRPPKFSAYYDVIDVKPVNGATWRLELSGLIADKRPWTLPQLQVLPQTSMVIKHICVEGWSYIGGWTGVPLRVFLERVGADLRAKYVAFKTADDYPSSIDMATALHPQTVLATEYGGETLADPETVSNLGVKRPLLLRGSRRKEGVIRFGPIYSLCSTPRFWTVSVALAGQVTIQRVQRGPQHSRRGVAPSCTSLTLEMVHDRVDAIDADPGVGGFAVPQPPVQALNFPDDHSRRRLARWSVARQTAGDLLQVLKSHSDVKPVEKRRCGDTRASENVPKSRTAVGEGGQLGLPGASDRVVAHSPSVSPTFRA